MLRNHATTRGLDEPVPTITTSGAHLGLCEPFFLGQQSGAAARGVDHPAPTVATGGAISLIEPFIFANRTHAAPKGVTEPVPTLYTGNHIALIEAYGARREAHERARQATGDGGYGRTSTAREATTRGTKQA